MTPRDAVMVASCRLLVRYARAGKVHSVEGMVQRSLTLEPDPTETGALLLACVLGGLGILRG